MIDWLKSMTFGASTPLPGNESPTPAMEHLVRRKASSIAKATPVRIGADNTPSDPMERPTTTAATALAIELAKQPVWPPQHSPPVSSFSSSAAASIRSSEFSYKASKHSLLTSTLKKRQSLETRLTYQCKSSAASTSVSVSVAGSTAGVMEDEHPVTRPASITDGDSCRSGIQPHASSAAARLLQQHISSQSSLMIDTKEGLDVLASSPTSIHSRRGDDKGQDLDASKIRAPSCTGPDHHHQHHHQKPSTSPALPAPNMVLPAFHSEYSKPEVADKTGESSTYSASTLLETAIETLATMCMSKETRAAFRAPADNAFDPLGKLKHFFKDLGHGAEKRIVVVGIHGWFPTKLVRSMIGEPTGTSQKFCDQMTVAVKRYMSDVHHIDLPDSAVTAIPLEYEGKVEDRVNRLYHKLVDNIYWLEAISSADAILWGTHSQGTPVTTMLVQRLLQQGLIHTKRQSICMLAMAGIGQGPFPSLKGSLIVKYFEADAARELFEFMDSESTVSLKFRTALSDILCHGVKTVLVGSMQDQVVPLYSAIMSSVSHPGILRAVYIDGHIYAHDDFVINLVVFALQLRNAGLSDHGLLENMSEMLAGSLYALEGGHSTIYEEVGVYLYAVRCLFETPPIGELQKTHQPEHPTYPKHQLHLQAPRLDRFQAKTRVNPFHLPWALRGIFDDVAIKTHPVFYKELVRLQDLFVTWKPKDARMREIKFRLEPLQHYILPLHS